MIQFISSLVSNLQAWYIGTSASPADGSTTNRLDSRQEGAAVGSKEGSADSSRTGRRAARPSSWSPGGPCLTRLKAKDPASPRARVIRSYPFSADGAGAAMGVAVVNL